MIGRGFAGLTRVRGTQGEPKLGIIVRRKVSTKITAKPKSGHPSQPTSGIGVRFVAPFFDGSGYAEGARQWLAAMVNAGIDVRADPVSFETARADYGPAGEIVRKAVGREINCKISMIYLTPDMYPLHRKNGHYNIGLFEWETDRLPSEWVHECNAMDELWVPCSWVADVARAAGVKKPIEVIGHCFNPEEYRNAVPLDFPEIPRQAYKFYTIFQWTERKNPNALIRAYLTAFRKKDPVILIVKAYRCNYSPEEQHWVFEEIQKIKKDVGGSQPSIMLIPEMLNRKEILGLHATGDCFALAHRSEGWGLSQFDACAMGKAVIGTRYGGNLEFMDDDTSFLVDYELTPVKGMDWIPWYNEGMSWADPDIGECRKIMRYVYNNRSKGLEKGAMAKRNLARRFTWDTIGGIIKARLMGLAEIIK